MTVSTQALPQRITGVLRSAAKVRGAQWIRIHRQTDRELELVSVSPTTDEELRDGLSTITIMEECQLRIRDDLASLPQNGEPAIYIVSIRGEEDRELARDRIRLKTSAPESTELARPTAPPGSKDWENTETRSPSASVMQSALLRQQYRHNEALAGSVVKSFSGTIQQLTGLVSTLGESLDKSIRARLTDADASIAVARQARVMEAEARAEESRAEALKLTAGTLAEWLPVALHKIARKYGMSGDDAIDPMLEKMILSFKPEQLEGLQNFLTPSQREMFADVWLAVDERVRLRKEKAAADAKAREAESRKITGGASAIVVAEITNGGNGAAHGGAA